MIRNLGKICSKCRTKSRHVQDVVRENGKLILRTACLDCGNVERKEMKTEGEIRWVHSVFASNC